MIRRTDIQLGDLHMSYETRDEHREEYCGIGQVAAPAPAPVDEPLDKLGCKIDNRATGKRARHKK